MKLDDCEKYELEFPNLSKVNSQVIHGRVVYIGKKLPTGKDGHFYHGYDYETKICLGRSGTKEGLIAFLTKQDFGAFDG